MSFSGAVRGADSSPTTALASPCSDNSTTLLLSLREAPLSTRRVRSWVVLAALLTLFCNAPAGAVALFFAIRASTLASAGNEEEARKMGQFAALACLLTVPFGLFVGCSGYGTQSLLGW